MKPIFPRGPGPLVSVLLPSRGRPEGLRKAVRSLYDLAKDKSLVEFCIKADEDDRPTADTVREIAESCPGSKFFLTVSPRGNGYYDLHHYVNDLVTKATGDWLLLFNDDIKVKTPEWEQVLLWTNPSSPWVGIEDVCYFKVKVREDVTSGELFFLRRKVTEILGHFALCPFMDGWIEQVMMAVHHSRVLPISFSHDRLQEVIVRDDEDEMNRTVWSVKYKRLASRDVNKLHTYLEQVERDGLRNDPVPGYWHIWKKDGLCYVVGVDTEGMAALMEESPPKIGPIPEGGQWVSVSPLF